MLRNLFTKALWDQRRGILVWSVAIAAVGAMYAAFYPSMNNPDMAAALEAYPQEVLEALGMTDITSAAGYLSSTTYGLLGPILIIIFAATLGIRAVAGDEENGRLDVLLAHPVERWSVVVQRFGAMVVAASLAGLLVFLALAALSGPAELEDIGPGNLAAASTQMVLLGLVFGSAGLAVGALTGSRGVAWAVVALGAVGTYFANTLGPAIEALAWTQDLSPFHYFSGGRPLVNGLQVGDSAILAVTALALVAIASVGFRRRDVAV